MTVAFVQGKAAFSSTSSNTTVTATFDAGATAGNFLICIVGGDKNGGAAALSGWTELYELPSTSVSLYVWYKIAAGGETAVSPTWTTGTFGSNIYIAEYADTAVTGATSWEILGSASNITNESTTLTPSTGTTGSIANTGRAVACAALDSSQNVSTVTGWSNSFTARHSGTGLVGRAGLFTAEAAISSGGGVTTTLTVTGTADQWSGAILVFRKYNTTATPALAHRIVGTNGIIKTRTADADSVRIKIGTDSGVTTGVVWSSAETPDGLGDAFHDLTGLGLSSSTRYYYRVAMTDTAAAEHLDTEGTIGRVKVAPTGATSFNFCFSSCSNSTTSAAVPAITARADDFFLHLGDLYYNDGSGQTVSNFRNEMVGRIQTAGHQDLLSSTPTAYIPSDHDWGMASDSGGTSQSGATAPFNQVYREVWPANLVETTTGVHHTFVWGRVRFVMLDCRTFRSANGATDNSGKTMLGTDQKDWLFDLIDTAPEMVFVICSDSPWTGPTTASEDHWAGFNTERQEIVTYLLASNKQAIVLSGDMHAVAHHNGSGVTSGIGNWSASPLYNSASIKGAPWDDVYPASGSAIVQQYGRVVVTDSGDEIELAFTGYSSDNTSRVTASETFTVGWTGVVAQTLPSVSQAASGTFEAEYTGTVAQTLPHVTQAATGTVTAPVFTGAAAQTLPAVGQAASGTVTPPVFTGAAAQTLPRISQAVSGSHTPPTWTGNAAQTLPSVTQSATGTSGAPSFTATVAQTLPSVTQAVSGEVDNPPGSITQTLPAVTQSATGTHTAPTWTGAGAQTLPAITQAAVGTVAAPTYTGAVAQSLPAVTQAAAGTSGTPTYTAVITQTLPAVTQLASTGEVLYNVTWSGAGTPTGNPFTAGAATGHPFTVRGPSA